MSVQAPDAPPYTLFCWRNSYAMTAQVMLEELGLEHDLRWITIHIPMEQKDPAFLKANPNGRVPTLLTPEGPIYETGAILVYLAERHPEAGLMPAIGDPRRRHYWQWHFYLVSTFQPEELILEDASVYLPGDETGQAHLKQVSVERMRGIWRVLDDAVADGPYLLGELYTTCDISFAMQALWPSSHPPEGLGAYPNAVRCLRTVLQRPAVQRVLTIHDVLGQADI